MALEIISKIIQFNRKMALVCTSSSFIEKLDNKGSVMLCCCCVVLSSSSSFGRIDERRDFGVEYGTESSPDFSVQQNGRVGGVDDLTCDVGPGLNGDGLILNLRRRRSDGLCGDFNGSGHLMMFR